MLLLENLHSKITLGDMSNRGTAHCRLLDVKDPMGSGGKGRDTEGENKLEKREEKTRTKNEK